MFDPDTGEVYPALSCINDKAMAERCKYDNAPKVIWSIKASQQFNNDICLLLRSGFQKGKINLLISDFESEEDGTRLRGTVEIAGITELSPIKVFLKTVEQVLHTSIKLQIDMLLEQKCIIDFQV